MSPALLCVLAVGGMLITGFAATGSKALQDFSRRELEVYARRRGRSDRFSSILDGYEQAELGLESLQIIGTTILTLSLLGVAINATGSDAGFNALTFSATALVSMLVLLSVTTWIPEAVLSLWTSPFVYHSWPEWHCRVLT